MLKLSEQKPSSLSSDDNMIPLINIVFLMLIFFMVAGHIEKTDNLNIDLPQSTSDIAIEEQWVKLYIDQAGLIQFADEPISRDVLTETLQGFLTNSSAPEQIHLVVQVDAELPSVELKSVLADVKASGIRRVSLATLLLNS